MLPRAARAFVVLTCIAVAGCGGDGTGKEDDEKAIRDVVRLSLTTNDTRGDCQRRLSSGLIRKTYGTRKRCIEVQKDEDDDSADAVTVPRVDVDGDDATAGIRIRGGDTDGATGELALVREEGDWRIDGISVPLLRSLVEVGLRSGDGGLPAGALACISRSLDRLPDAELRRVAYQLVGETDAAKRRIFQILAECPGEGGRSFLLQIFQQGVVESLRERGASAREVQCVVGRLRADLSDEELVEFLTGANSRAAARRVLGPAIAACDS